MNSPENGARAPAVDAEMQQPDELNKGAQDRGGSRVEGQGARGDEQAVRRATHGWPLFPRSAAFLSSLRGRKALPLLIPSSLVVAHLIRTRTPQRWRRPLLIGALAVTLTAAVAVGPGWTAGPANIFVDTALVGEKAHHEETEIGDLIADAFRAATGADIALIAAGEIRDVNLGPGNLTVNQIVEALVNPNDAVAVLPLKGSELRQALEFAVERYPTKNNKGFLQVSGLEFSFDPNRSSDRVVSVSVNGQPLQNANTYRVAMSSSLAAGAYVYFRLWNKDRATGQQGLTLASAVQGYLRDHPSLSLRTGRRIIVRSGR
jgi:5'-nucleotidase, C-terminal domain